MGLSAVAAPLLNNSTSAQHATAAASAKADSNSSALPKFEAVKEEILRAAGDSKVAVNTDPHGGFKATTVGSSCTVSFPAAENNDALKVKLKDEGLPGNSQWLDLEEMFIARHEGSHCYGMPRVRNMGSRIPYIGDLALAFPALGKFTGITQSQATKANELFSDFVAAAFALKDAYATGKDEVIQRTNNYLLNVALVRIMNRNTDPDHFFGGRGIRAAMAIPQEELLKMPDEKIRNAAFAEAQSVFQEMKLKSEKEAAQSEVHSSKSFALRALSQRKK